MDRSGTTITTMITSLLAVALVAFAPHVSRAGMAQRYGALLRVIR